MLKILSNLFDFAFLIKCNPRDSVLLLVFRVWACVLPIWNDYELRLLLRQCRKKKEKISNLTLSRASYEYLVCWGWMSWMWYPSYRRSLGGFLHSLRVLLEFSLTSEIFCRWQCNSPLLIYLHIYIQLSSPFMQRPVGSYKHRTVLYYMLKILIILLNPNSRKSHSLKVHKGPVAFSFLSLQVWHEGGKGVKKHKTFNRSKSYELELLWMFFDR